MCLSSFSSAFPCCFSVDGLSSPPRCSRESEFKNRRRTDKDSWHICRRDVMIPGLSFHRYRDLPRDICRPAVCLSPRSVCLAIIGMTHSSSHHIASNPDKRCRAGDRIPPHSPGLYSPFSLVFHKLHTCYPKNDVPGVVGEIYGYLHQWQDFRWTNQPVAFPESLYPPR